ncbi:MAG: hypothetical protein ACPGYV_00470 [Phycisphaeraceae bacterium]
METEFTILNDGWNAEPNAPCPQIDIHGSDVLLTFVRNHLMYSDVEEDSTMSIRFKDCHKYRLGPTNDEGWYRGQCRFSKIAPQWGEFYEIQGNTLDEQLNKQEWKILPGNGTKRFLFYFRDETFECDAESYELTF